MVHFLSTPELACIVYAMQAMSYGAFFQHLLWSLQSSLLEASNFQLKNDCVSKHNRVSMWIVLQTTIESTTTYGCLRSVNIFIQASSEVHLLCGAHPVCVWTFYPKPAIRVHPSLPWLMPCNRVRPWILRPGPPMPVVEIYLTLRVGN